MKLRIYLVLLLTALLLTACSGQQISASTQGNTSIVSQIRTFLEMVSFASSPLLLVVAIMGLKQLYFAKSQIEITKNLAEIQAKRVSIEAAANECRIFSEKVIPLLGQIDKYVAENEITLFNDVKLVEHKDHIELDFSNVKPDEPAKLAGIGHLISNYFNGLELFALYFVSGIADENIAFLTMGNLYVNEVERLMVIMGLAKISQDDCRAIWDLYFPWKERIKEQRLKKEKFELKTKEFEIDSKLNNVKYETRKPIGTQ